MQKREVDLVIISDVHLGTYGCKAKELLHYLQSIHPTTLILNGDIIDIWQFRKSYWTDTHKKVLNKIIDFASEGVLVHYLTGNHDEMLRKFTGFTLGNIRLLNQLIIELDGKKTWIFHGDIFDSTIHRSKWLAKSGAIGYGILIRLNDSINRLLKWLGLPPVYFSKRIKATFKKVLNFIDPVIQSAIEKKYDYVVCGHTHQAEIREIKNEKGAVLYLNSGDWVESLTALEYHQGQWKIFNYLNEALASHWAEVNYSSQSVKHG